MLKRVSSNCTEIRPGISVDKRLVDVVGLEKNRRRGKYRERETECLSNRSTMIKEIKRLVKYFRNTQNQVIISIIKLCTYKKST